MHHVHEVALPLAVLPGQVLCDHHRAVAAPGAADAHGQVRLALGLVRREQVVEEGAQAGVELADAVRPLHVLDHLGVEAGEVAQILLIVRVGQEADVEGEVGVARRAVLVAEGEEADRQAPERALGQHLVGHHLPQPGGGEIGGVDGDVGALLERGQQRALLGDGAVERPALGQRVAPARLFEAIDERVRRGLQEQQPVGHALPGQLLEHAGHALERLSSAHVGHHRRPLHLAAVMAEQLSQRGDHLRRQVVDAEVAGVLEASHRLGLARPREAADQHEVLYRGAHLTLCTYSWISRATLPGRPGTASSSSLLASRKRSGVPKCWRIERLRAGPTPGRSSSTDRVIELSRRARWNSIANRCASSRTRCSSWSSGVSWSSTSGCARPGMNTSSIRLARLITVTPRSRNGASSRMPAESWPLPPSITIRPGRLAKLWLYSRSCGERSFCATYWAIRLERTSLIAPTSSCTASRMPKR